MSNNDCPTGFPSIDKPWLKYYPDEAVNSSLPVGSMYDYLKECNLGAEDDIAIIYFHRKITYRELYQQIDSIASSFLSLGVKAGDVVALALPNIPENVYCLYALNRIGAIADFIDLRSQGDSLVRYLDETDARVAVLCDMFLENELEIHDLTNIEHVVVVSPVQSLHPLIRFLNRKRIPKADYIIRWKDFLQIDAVLKKTSRDASGVASCIFHTSGTTGPSKGALFTNQSCNAMALQGKLVPLRFDAGGIMMNQVPPFLAFNILCSTHLPLCLHMTIKMLPDYRPDKFAQRIVETGANVCLAGPADWGNFLEDKKLMGKDHDLSHLVTPISGSDALSRDAKSAIRNVLASKGCSTGVYEGYGMTEIGSAACCNMPGMNKDASVGVPFCLNSFCIYDVEKDEELPYMHRGEICMTGPTLMEGYFNNQYETNKVLRVHGDGKRWLHSGDLGYMDEDGFIYIEGRLKRIIVRHDGIKVSPFEIERVVMSLPEVEACCVVGTTDTNAGFGQRPFVFFSIENDSKLTETDVEALCKGELADLYLPVGYKIVESIPLTDNGKVDYRELEKWAGELSV